MTTTNQEEKRYDPGDTTLKFVNRPDDLDPMPPEEGDQGLCAEMSCGHAVTPENLTLVCRNLLDQGQYILKCQALNKGTSVKCNKVLSYQEVRRLAVLTTEEMAEFEEKMARLAAEEYCETKECPGCKTFVERKNLTNLSVVCPICKKDGKIQHTFCWQCLKKWKGPMPRSDRCDNDGCVNLNLELLKNCKDTSLPRVRGMDKCPSIRACPTCGQCVEHDRTGCKNIICQRCQVEFCFVCLKLTSECLKTSSYFIPCKDGVAPRQTSIPVWHHK